MSVPEHLWSERLSDELPQEWDWDFFDATDAFLAERVRPLKGFHSITVHHAEGSVTKNSVGAAREELDRWRLAPKRIQIFGDSGVLRYFLSSEDAPVGRWTSMTISGVDRERVLGLAESYRRALASELLSPTDPVAGSDSTSSASVAREPAQPSKPPASGSTPRWRVLLPDLRNVRDNLYANLIWLLILAAVTVGLVYAGVTR